VLIHNAAEWQNTLEREVKPHKSGSASHHELVTFFKLFVSNVPEN